MKITKNTTIQEIVDMPVFAPMRNAFIGAVGDWMNVVSGSWTIEEITAHSPTWHYDDILLGISRLAEVAESEEEYVFDIYSQEERDADPALNSVKLIYHPAKGSCAKANALLLSGGGYGAVCTLVESMPVAARLNELGVTAFSLNYRTASKDTTKEGLMPKPVDDVARAIRFIETHFGIAPETLIVGGFSAGGHLAAMWGAKYSEYGLPKPRMLMLDYPLITLENFDEPVRNMFAAGLLGEAWNEELARTMSVDKLVTADYPKTYLVTALDDETVPLKDSRDMEEALLKNNIPCLIERVEHGGHGFGLGSVTEAAGWVDRAMAYLEKQTSLDIERAMEQYVANSEIAGGALIVRKNGKIVFKNKWGYADIAAQEPVEYNSIFRMMSLSKVAVAVAVMKLIEDGKIGLDTPLSKYIPEFKNPRVVNDRRYTVKEGAAPTAFLRKIIFFRKNRVKTVPADREVTIRDLLSHSSGIEMGVYGFLRLYKYPETRNTLKEVAEKYADYPLDFQPGTGTGYSGMASFDILLRVCEIVTGLEGNSLMQKIVFEPLGMKDTAFWLTPEQETRLVKVYKHEKQGLRDVTNTAEDMDGTLHRGKGFPSGSGGLFSTVEDYERLASMLCAEGTIDGVQYLKPETVRLMSTEAPAMHLETEPGWVWGLGVKIRQDKEKGGFKATEGTYGWSGAFGTHLFVSPKDKISCVFVSNRSNAGGSGFYISRAIEDMVFEAFAEE